MEAMFGRVTEAVTGTASAVASKASDTVKAGVARVLARMPGASVSYENTRNTTMLTELKDFKPHVHRLHTEITQCSSKLADSIGVVAHMMVQPLPRAYDFTTATWAVQAVDEHTHRVGEGVDISAMGKACADMVARVQKEVLVPMDTWCATVTALEKKNLQCDALAMELEVQRKHVESAERNAAELQSKGHKDTRTAMDQLQAEQAKEQSLHLRFVTTEAQIFNELLWCIQEAMELRRYSLVALQSLQEFLVACTSAFNLQEPIQMKLPAQVDPSKVGQAMPSGEAAKGFQVPQPSHEQASATEQAAFT